jgi:V/A-type H+-transporting ATPase subunit I
MLASLLDAKFLISHQEQDKVVKDIDIDKCYKDFTSIKKEIDRIKADTNETEHLLEKMAPWDRLDIPLEELQTNGRVRSCLAQIDNNNYEVFRNSLLELNQSFELEEINQDKRKIYFLIIFLKELEDKIIEFIKKYKAEIIEFKDLKGTVKDNISRLKHFRQEYRQELVKLEDEVKDKCFSQEEKLKIINDYLTENLTKKEIESKYLNTEKIFTLTGWIKAKDENEIRSSLGNITSAIEIKTREPLPDENPPIELENIKLFKPFEFVTTLYGRPLYTEYDPTPFMAPFYAIFFALCLTDAVYGAILVAVSGFVLWKFKPKGGAKQLFSLLLMSGLITVIAGVLTGGWLGLDTKILPNFMQNLVFLNPMKDPLGMFYFALFCGMIHVLFGMGIKMYAYIKEGKLKEAIFEQIAWILFLICLAPLFYSGLFGGKISDIIKNVAIKGCFLFGGLIILTGGLKYKNIFGKIFGGVFKIVYDVIGYFADVVSFARLFALGLATGAIAASVNKIAQMVTYLPFYIGYIFAILIFIGGHIFNIVINCLGAFVHSARLQFIEFFSKFFEGGGQEFKPLKIERNYTIIK